MLTTRTYVPRERDIKNRWLLVDAKGLVLGRMASQIALLLRGKTKPYYTPYLDCGDYVIVINAAHLALTGKKRSDKVYWRHSGYPGGIKSRRARDILEGSRPEHVLHQAVKRMIPRGPLGREQLRKLLIHPHDYHMYQAQQPVPVDIAAMNEKNQLRKRASHS